jgi:hypothetical protein
MAWFFGLRFRIQGFRIGGREFGGERGQRKPNSLEARRGNDAEAQLSEAGLVPQLLWRCY